MRQWSELTDAIGQRLDRTFETARCSLSIIGLLTVLLVALQALSQGIQVVSLPTVWTTSEDASEREQEKVAPVAVNAVDPRQRATAAFLSRQYRIAPEAAEQLVVSAFHAGGIVGLDPALLLAVMAVESRFNPIAESDMGAKGLMQVIPKFHGEKLNGHGGVEAVLDPWVNILVGAQILQEYIGRAGSLEAGLQWYNGAANDKTRQYAERILSEKAHFDRILKVRRQRTPETKV
jgi:soluble lytic murein transglycosylase-like protein